MEQWRLPLPWLNLFLRIGRWNAAHGGAGTAGQGGRSAQRLGNGGGQRMGRHGDGDFFFTVLRPQTAGRDTV